MIRFALNMEFTQRLECTQELNGTHSERISSEQIGFLGICGTKYPVIKGPNKIGRDPQTCNIVLNLNSVSRQHAVLNILNKNAFMLMDMDSANKTKLRGKALQPYIPHPIYNGDTVQFGEIFGVFRLLEEDYDLPMTQALDIPDTPVPTRHMSRINAATTIPESPDVSDKDDSFIVPSQPKGPQFMTKIQNYVKPGKTISIQPIGTKTIDNVYWNSSKKSTSFNLDESDRTLNDSIPSNKLKEKENLNVNDIHDLETQEIFAVRKVNNENTDSIYSANTQLPDNIHMANTQMPEAAGSPSIHSLNTQMPCGTSSPTIHSLNTQMPGAFDSPPVNIPDTQLPESLPEVVKINESDNKNNDSIYNAETQIFPMEKKNLSPSRSKSNHSKVNVSDEVVKFNEIDNECFDEGIESQAILTEDIDLPINMLVEQDIDSQSQIIKPKCSKRNMRIKSDSSEEDIIIIPTQKTPEKADNDEDVTDCEEDMIELNPPNKTNVLSTSKIPIDFEDMATQVIDIDNAAPKIEEDIGDMVTQVLNECIEKDKAAEKGITNDVTDFEDLPTQVLNEDITENKSYNFNQCSEEIVISPFKIPSNSALKSKKGDVQKPIKVKPTLDTRKSLPTDAEEKYYQCTQDIFEELCTQRIGSPELTPKNNIAKKSTGTVNVKSIRSINKSTTQGRLDTTADEKVNNFVSNLSSQEIRDVIGVETTVAGPTKVPSDGSASSDIEVTPKRPIKVMDTSLPNSQEIKTGVSLNSKSLVVDISSDSDTDNTPEDQNTPIVHRPRRKKLVPKEVLNVTKKLDVEKLPSRVITRPRKPPLRLHDEHEINSHIKPKYLSEHKGYIDNEIITENITRLKNEMEKSKIDKSCKESKTIKHGDTTKVHTSPTTRDHNMSKKSQKDKLENEVETKNLSKDDKRISEPNNNTKKDNKTSKNNTIISSSSATEKFDSTEEPKSKTRSAKSNVLALMRIADIQSPIRTRSRTTRTTNTTKPENQIITSSGSSKTEKERSPDRKSKTDKMKRTKKEPKSPTKVVRRSRRQKTAKEPVKIKSILKNNTETALEKSAVYNHSSGSNSESPRSLKRPALDESNAPSNKRQRSVGQSNITLRSTPARMMRTQYVLFTAYPDIADVKSKLESIGAVVVSDVMKCTVLVTTQIRRTFKLLCAVGLGKPIVGPNWIQACIDTNLIVDPWLYIIKDDVVEKRYEFSIHQTLSSKRNFLLGYNLSSTPTVLPQPSEMKMIVECSGGVWKEGGPNWLCVTRMADQALWPALVARGATLVLSELILAGALTQKLDIEKNKLPLSNL